jgi:hypothetical protein
MSPWDVAEPPPSPPPPSTPSPDDWFAARSLPDEPPKRRRTTLVVVVVVAVVVVAAGVLVDLRFFPAHTGGPSAPPGPVEVNFTATGLPAGELWTISIWNETVSTAGTTISFPQMPAGNYSYYANATGEAPICANLVVKTSALVVPVNFTKAVTYPVVFSENGIIPSDGWTVSLGCFWAETTTSLTITIAEPNGTYGFHIYPGYGYSCTVVLGRLTVNGSALLQKTTCSETTYPAVTPPGSPGAALPITSWAGASHSRAPGIALRLVRPD